MTGKPIRVKCDRCGGRGRIDAFSHRMGGVCFKCGGSGYRVTTEANEASAKRRRVKTAEKREAEREARYRADLTAKKAAGWTWTELHDNACACEDGSVGHEAWRRDFEEA